MKAIVKLCQLALLTLIPSLIFCQDTIRINIDVGQPDSTLPWNNLSNVNSGRIDQLLESQGTLTDIGIEVIDAFNGINTSGTLSSDPSLGLPSTATGDSFFGNTEIFSDKVEPTGAVQLFGLDVDKTYQITLFASRLASDNRETAYLISSGGQDTVQYLAVADNTMHAVVFDDISPTADGTITIHASPGPQNNNSFGFFYLGAISVRYAGTVIIPEPELSLTSPTGGEYWQPGKAPDIRWESKGINGEVFLEYSINSGDTWLSIDSVSALSQRYSWSIPATPSEECKIRIHADTISLESPEAFEISALSDTTDCHIVVLGSSTAAGTGPTTRDSAWVWMYRDTLFQNDTRFRVTNLALGGFTTYNILPDGTTIPGNVTRTVDTLRNITEAMSLEPDALIINLPSNDAASGYPVEDQLENYDLILAETLQDSIPVWVCTPQPRNGFSMDQIQIQEDLRDSTFSRFGIFAIDFWSTLASVDGLLEPDFNSGDGVHLNNLGHKLLLSRILENRINEYLISKKSDGPSSTVSESIKPLNIYPNPTEDTVIIEEVAPPYDYKLVLPSGELVREVGSYNSNKIRLEQSGLQYILIMKDGVTYGGWLMKYGR